MTDNTSYDSETVNHIVSQLNGQIKDLESRNSELAKENQNLLELNASKDKTIAALMSEVNDYKGRIVLPKEVVNG